MQIQPYLNFNGECKEAFTFYQKTLGGKLESMITHGDSPIANEVPPDWHDRILHARLVVDDADLAGSGSLLRQRCEHPHA